MTEAIIFTDGGSRGNPGIGAGGYVICNSKGTPVKAKGVFLGDCTNNYAEYTGLIKALEDAASLGINKVSVFTDSQLLVRQIKGEYKVKSENLKPLYDRAIALLKGFKSWKVDHVYREKNSHADAMANKAMDKQKDVEEIFSKLDSVSEKKIKLAILISGGGTTMLNINEHITAGRLNAEISIVISSRSDVKGIERAKKANLPIEIIRKKDFTDISCFSGAIADVLDKCKVDLVIQAGWLCLWNIPEKYTGRVMNIHPALLPSFGGQGMWGHHVHEAVLAKGCKVSGCTVHFCTNEYDKGPIIIQKTCPVEEGDNADTLAERVFQQECIAYPQAIKLFAQQKLKIDGQVVRILK
jgi:formyltetrahydrofolate-dependent phosphoribosylglycinamide formyltransferase